MDDETLSFLIGKKKYDGLFKGVYSLVEFLQNSTLILVAPAYVIVHISGDNSSKIGHFILLMLMSGDTCLYIDSFAKQPGFYADALSKYVYSFKKTQFLPYRIQSRESKLCSVFCLFYIKFILPKIMLKDHTLAILTEKYFTPNNFHLNERNLVKWFLKYYDIRSTAKRLCFKKKPSGKHCTSFSDFLNVVSRSNLLDW
jgi:hypothetical protein